MYVCENCSCNVLEMLLGRQDLNINIQDNNGKSALLYCLEESLGGNEYDLNFEGAELLLGREDLDISVKTPPKKQTCVNHGERNITYFLQIEDTEESIELLKKLISRGIEFEYIEDCYCVDEFKHEPYLPRWSRITYKYYPKRFDRYIFAWLLVCKRLKIFPKDIVYLIIEYIAENWKIFIKNSSIN